MSNRNPLLWLDSLVEALKSNPHETLSSETESHLHTILSYIKQEVFFTDRTKKNRKVAVNYFHETLVYYMNELYAIGQKYTHISDGEKVKATCNELHGKLRLQLDFLEIHFHDYLKDNRKISRYYLSSAKDTLKELIGKIERKKISCAHTKNVIGIVIDTTKKFISTVKYPYAVTYNCVQYRVELLRKINELSVWEPQDNGTFPLDNLLLLMNFNSKTYVSYLITELSESIESTTNKAKEELLLNYYKGLRQLHSLPGYAFNPEYHGILDLLDKWFDEEINFYRKLTTLTDINVTETKGQPEAEKSTTSKSKVLCTLSADQIALMLRAADEVRMLSARSLTAVFRSIVPHISTRQTTDLSFESVRIKSYNAEDSDKQAAIRTLKKMIDKIQDY